jgi:hypothetical protein
MIAGRPVERDAAQDLPAHELLMVHADFLDLIDDPILTREDAAGIRPAADQHRRSGILEMA